MKIAVLCGGLSPERNVSLSGATLICKALRSLGHKAVLMDMFFGSENIDTPVERLFDELPEISEVSAGNTAPDLKAVEASRKWKNPSKIGPGVLELCRMADVVFLALHGACGEDGRIQATLDLMGIPYTGSGFLGSALAMDKDLTKRVIAPLGIKTPQWETISSYTENDIADICARIQLPVVVKPVDSGSSIGVSIAHTKEELETALKENLDLPRVIIEQYVSGREIDVGVLDGKALPSIEIRPKHGFYDYENKYKAGATEEICPSPIDPEIEAKLGEATVAVHNALGLRSYSRSDFILDSNGDIWFLEINTLPGMTPTSLMPQEAAAVGISYEALCSKVVALAMEGK